MCSELSVHYCKVMWKEIVSVPARFGAQSSELAGCNSKYKQIYLPSDDHHHGDERRMKVHI